MRRRRTARGGDATEPRGIRAKESVEPCSTRCSTSVRRARLPSLLTHRRTLGATGDIRGVTALTRPGGRSSASIQLAGSHIGASSPRPAQRARSVQGRSMSRFGLPDRSSRCRARRDMAANSAGDDLRLCARDEPRDLVPVSRTVNDSPRSTRHDFPRRVRSHATDLGCIFRLSTCRRWPRGLPERVEHRRPTQHQCVVSAAVNRPVRTASGRHVAFSALIRARAWLANTRTSFGRGLRLLIPPHTTLSTENARRIGMTFRARRPPDRLGIEHGLAAS